MRPAILTTTFLGVSGYRAIAEFVGTRLEALALTLLKIKIKCEKMGELENWQTQDETFEIFKEGENVCFTKCHSLQFSI